MATSGSFDTGGYNGKHLTFSWYRSNTPNGADNYSDITWSLVGAGGSSWHMSGNFKVIIDGETVYSSSDRIKLYNGTTVASGTKRIYHNSDGSRSFSAYAEAGIYTYAVNCTGSGSWTLDSIPRYLSSINIYNNGSALNSISVKWTCNPRRDWTQYSLNGGGWTDAGDSVASDGKSGTFNIGGLAPNTSYNVRVRLRRADSGLWSESGTITITTKNKATITSPNDNFSVNSGNALTVNCNNPSGNQIAYFLDCPSGTRRLTSGKTTNTSYTWSAAQILSMLQYFTTSNSSSIKVGVITYGNAEYYSEKVGTLNVVNSNPTFSNFSYEDTNATTIQLTGGNQAIVKGYSNVKAIVSTANKAVAKNYASMSKYRLVIGSKQLDINYSSSSSVNGTINKVDSNIFNMYAIDSRGNSTVKQISPSRYLDYTDIIIKQASVIRTGGVGSEVTLAFSGAYWGYGFGAMNNAITSCYYEYKTTTASSWTRGGNLTPIIEGNNFAFEGTIRGDAGANGFTITKSFNIRVVINDRLSSSNYTMTLGTGTPGISVHKNGVGINRMFDTSNDGALQVGGAVKSNDGARYVVQYLDNIGSSDDFNDFIIPGIFSVGSGSSITNAPYTGSIYGYLEVMVNTMKKWVPSDSGSWVWQKFYSTSGHCYVRNAVNSTIWSSWTQIY
jgi:hypothetical protein